MNAYLINSRTFGLCVVMADTETEALVKTYTEDLWLGDCFLDREDLIKRGYRKMERTNQAEVFLLLDN